MPDRQMEEYDTAPAFAPQWGERRIETEMDVVPYGPECRICGCTDESACEGGCFWVEGDLCSSCDQLMAAYPMLRMADGYGIAAWNADVGRLRAECQASGRDDDWVCPVCDLLITGDELVCPKCAYPQPNVRVEDEYDLHPFRPN